MQRIWMMYVGERYRGKFIASNDEALAKMLVANEAGRRGIDPGAVHLVGGPVLTPRTDDSIPF